MSEQPDIVRIETTQPLNQRRMDRRGLMRRAGAMGLAASGLGTLGTGYARAQDATPSADGPALSMTRDEYHATLTENFAFEEPQNKGGQVIFSQTSDIATVNGLLTADYPTFYITGYLFETLVGTSPVDGQVVPALADSWELRRTGRPTPSTSTRMPSGTTARTSPLRTSSSLSTSRSTRKALTPAAQRSFLFWNRIESSMTTPSRWSPLSPTPPSSTT